MIRRNLLVSFAALSAASFAPAVPVLAQDDLTDLTIRFTWKLKGEYAPFFVALDKGYYEEEGLNVTLAEGSGSSTVTQLVGTGEELVGYGPSDSATQAINNGVSIKVVAVYHPDIPLVIVSYPDNPVREPKDLEGRTVAGSANGSFMRLLPAIAEANDMDIDSIDLVTVSGSVAVQQFLQKEVDVTTPYLNNEVPRMEKLAGVELVKVPVKEFGLELLGSGLFMNADFLEEQPEVVSGILAATAKGFADTIADPEQAARIFMEYLPAGEDMDVLTAQVVGTAATTGSVEGQPLGYQSEEAWRTMLETLQATGQIEEILPLETYYTNAFFE